MFDDDDNDGGGGSGGGGDCGGGGDGVGGDGGGDDDNVHDYDYDDGWRPRGCEQAQGDTSFQRFISQRFKISADANDLWQVVQPGPFGENQAQQGQDTVLPINCWGNRVDSVYPTESPHLNSLQAVVG